MAEFSERLDKFEGYFIHPLGMTERVNLDAQRLDREMKIMKDRLEQLEPRT